MINRPGPDQDPQTEIPKDRDRFDAQTVDSYFTGVQSVVEALDQHKLVFCCNPSGIPYVWREEGIYRGIVLRYRQVVENKLFDTAQAAAEWFEEMYYATY